jgi:hypothetical protein
MSGANGRIDTNDVEQTDNGEKRKIGRELYRL